MWQASGATALFIAAFGAAGYATRRDLAPLARYPSRRWRASSLGRSELSAADGADPCAPGAARRLHGDLVARLVPGERTAERRLR